MTDRQAEQWIVVSVVEYYGPRKQVSYLVGPVSEAEARRLAAAHDPDYDPTVNARRLAHNQASATYGQAARLVSSSGATSVYSDWTLLPDDVYDAACALLDNPADPSDEDARQALNGALDAAEMAEVYDQDQDTYYLVAL